jgi:GT2 family glycosyltransferase
VLSHNRRAELLRNLAALCTLEGATGFELIVVDNASTDGTREGLRELQHRYPDLKVVLSEKNLGVAGGRNLGWSVARGAFILNLDDDTHIELDAMLALRQAALDSAAVGLVTPQIVDAASDALPEKLPHKTREAANFAGACHLVRRAVWEQVGELDPGCSFGGEEIDYSIRARAAGYSTVCLGHVSARHYGVVRPRSSDRQRRGQWVYNYVRVIFKHFPRHRAVVLAGRVLIGHLASGVRLHGPAVAPALVLSTLRGAGDGRRSYVPLPKAALRFYSDPALRPDFGNVPLWRKAFERFRAAAQGRTPAAPMQQ